jgi:four helix bundle protein
LAAVSRQLSVGSGVGSFRELVVWQKAFALCLSVYKASATLPTHERYGLASELRKTARSILYNIAEGHRRSSRREFARFIDISLGSSAELQTQLMLSEALLYFEAAVAAPLLKDLDEINRMLFSLKLSLNVS